MTISTKEAIAVLEKYRAGMIANTAYHEDATAALTLAIDAMKSKSDAETVMEWLKQNEGWTLGIAGEYGWLVVKETEPFEPDIPAPTLSELAAKLREKA